jgi:deoxycytidine triphosphate deaminase
MSVLSAGTIRDLCAHTKMVHNNGAPLLIQPCSVDVRLDHLGDVSGAAITRGDWMEVTLSGGAFALGVTEEYFRMPENVVGHVMDKSSVARAGMTVGCVGLIDPGFEGQIVLELKNLLPGASLPLRRGMAIAQVEFVWLDQPVAPYDRYGHESKGSHYQGQTGIRASHLLPQ